MPIKMTVAVVAMAAMLGVAGVASAQDGAGTVATVQDVSGAVTITAGDTVKPAVEGSRVTDGAVVITAGDGSSVVVFDNGCNVRIEPNESLTVDTSLSCAALVAVPLQSPAFATGAQGGNRAALGVVGGAALIAAIIDDSGSTAPVSTTAPVSPQ